MKNSKSKLLIVSVFLSLATMTGSVFAKDKNYSNEDVDILLKSFSYTEQGMPEVSKEDLKILKRSYQYSEANEKIDKIKSRHDMSLDLEVLKKSRQYSEKTNNPKLKNI